MNLFKRLSLIVTFSLWGASAFAGATYSRIKTWSSGETLTASDLNAEFNNILNNLTPAGMDDYSATTTEMRALTDPYPGLVESQAASLQGEIERLRYQILQIKNTIQASSVTYWYQDLPTAGVFTIAGSSVGVNDTTPDYVLDVAGTLGVDGATTIGGALNTTGAAIAISSHATVAGDLTVSGGINFNGLTRISARPTLVSGKTSAADFDVIWNSEFFDSLNELSNSSFTVVSTGYYRISGMLQITAGGGGGAGGSSAFIILRKNGGTFDSNRYQSNYSEPGAQGQDIISLPFDWLVSLTAGDVLLIRANTTVNGGSTWGYNLGGSILNIVRVS